MGGGQRATGDGEHRMKSTYLYAAAAAVAVSRCSSAAAGIPFGDMDWLWWAGGRRGHEQYDNQSFERRRGSFSDRSDLSTVEFDRKLTEKPGNLREARKSLLPA